VLSSKFSDELFDWQYLNSRRVFEMGIAIFRPNLIYQYGLNKDDRAFD
jgi:hypothetical protein